MRYKEEFIEYLRYEKRSSAHTLLSYENDLRQFESFMQSEAYSDELPDKITIRAWVISELEKGKTPRTIHRKISSLRSFCGYLMRQGHMKTNPADQILKPRLRKSLPEFIEEEKMNFLLDNIEFPKDFKGARDRLILSILYQTGMRRAELGSLKVSSLDPDRKQLHVLGKRNKERIIPITDSLVSEIQEYIKIRNKEFPAFDGDVLFLTNNGQKIYDKLIYKIVKRYLSLITTRSKRSPHVLRHSFATHLLNKGADLNAIKELLGHANLAATQVYTHNSFEKLKNTYNKAHPRAD